MKTLNDLQKGLLLNTTLKNYKNSGLVEVRVAQHYFCFLDFYLAFHALSVDFHDYCPRCTWLQLVNFFHL